MGSEQQTKNRWPIIAALVAAAIAVGAIIGLVVVSSEPDWPESPALQHSLASTAAEGQIDQPPLIEGTVDDLYIAESGDGTSIVSHYLDGELAWKTEIETGEPWLTDIDDGRFVLMTAMPNEGDQTNLVRLDADTGATMWSVKSGPWAIAFFIEGRLFSHSGYSEDSTSEAMVEYDADTGAELNRIEDSVITFAPNGFMVIDPDNSTAQFLDVDFRAPHDPVPVEAAETEFFPWVVSYTPVGWLYYADGRLVAMDDAGAKLYECEVSIDSAFQVAAHDEQRLYVSSSESIEVFDVDGASCASAWSLSNIDDVDEFGPYVSAYEYLGDAENFGDDARIEIRDWATGDVVAAGEDDVSFDADGRMLTFDGNALVMREIDSGDELWRVAATEESSFVSRGSMVVLVNPGETEGTIEVYSDPRWSWSTTWGSPGD